MSPDLHVFLPRLTAAPDTATRLALFTDEVLRHGGSMVLPRQTGTWGPHYIELSLHGVAAMGEDPEEALRNWIRVARNRIEADTAPELSLEETLVSIPPRAASKASMRRACQVVLGGGSTRPDIIAKARQLADLLDRGMIA